MWYIIGHFAELGYARPNYIVAFAILYSPAITIRRILKFFFFDKRRILKLTSHFNVSPGIAVRPGEPRRGVPGRMEARGEVNEARPQGKQRVLRGHLDSPSLRSFATLSWCPLSAPAVGPCGVLPSSHFDMSLCLEPSVVAPCAVVHPD